VGLHHLSHLEQIAVRRSIEQLEEWVTKVILVKLD
jgi:hypothetical protein